MNISVHTLSGTGTITANGGGFEVGGGGGRIAIRYGSLTLDQANIKALGGQGNHAIGAKGTVYLELK